MNDRTLLVLQLGSTLPLVGLIWFVQIVAYPLFALAAGPESPGFAAYHRAHSTRITFLVLPLMLTELAASGAWLWWRPPAVSSAVAFTGAALVLVCWLATGLLAVPRHEELGRGFAVPAHAALVRGNWVRTVAWSVRGAMLLWLASR